MVWARMMLVEISRGLVAMGSEGRGSISSVSWYSALVTGWIMVVSLLKSLEGGTGGGGGRAVGEEGGMGWGKSICLSR